ncbi:UxaA family hydrolase [Halegenticoccus soli]|uniref:UxaA family hydrolase n=1 Tax=Halegenticoccus soli TaxID=1985678 RepID=UPI000C6CF7C6|nr:UxaA family hydrolase [Halegenticoccus soli]
MVDRYLKVVTPEDNVATALRDVAAGETVDVGVGDESRTVEIVDDVEFGHKVAIEDIDEGDTVYKYGLSIGYASRPIEAGEWVHVHNVDSNYGRGDLAGSAADRDPAEAIHE